MQNSNNNNNNNNNNNKRNVGGSFPKRIYISGINLYLYIGKSLKQKYYTDYIC